MISTIDDLRTHALTYAVVLLWALVPGAAGLGFVLGTGGVAVPVLLAAIAGAVTLESRRSGAGLSTQMAAAAGLAVGVSALVYLLDGHPWQADAHMIFFAAFALTAVFCDWRPIVTYAAVIAVHHLVLNFAFTAAVFPGEASLGRVLLHAAVLIVQAVPLIWLSTVLARLFANSDDLLAQATGARMDALAHVDQQTQEREGLVNIVSALSRGLHDLSEGDLTRPLTDDFGGHSALRDDFNATLTKLSDTITRVVDASQSIRDRSTEISTASEDLSRRTENQAAALEETAAALDELTASVKSAADGAREVEGIVRKARTEAEESKAVVEGAVAAMAEIEKSSQQISQIIGSIDDIAFQTNLLALNAGVEAARAGDAGKGFAVVASEVRALAQRSSSAAKEIKTLIGASAQHVGRGVDQVGKAGDALRNIVGSVTGISTLVSNIAVGATEQSTGLAEINIGVTQLDQVTQQNAAMVEESTAASHSLHQEATGLAAIVSTFRVGSGAAPSRVVSLPQARRSPVAETKPAKEAVEFVSVQSARTAGDKKSAMWQEF